MSSAPIEDAVEAMRNFLAGNEYDRASNVAIMLFDGLQRTRQSRAVAALAAELLETLPNDHFRFAIVADAEARSHMALGETERALRRYRQLLSAHEELALAKPNQADSMRDLSVSCERIGDLYRDLGRGDEARLAYTKSLAIAEQLVRSAPDRADYQHDLSITLSNLGGLYCDLGQVHEARKVYLEAIAIVERLVNAEPNRADYQRNLSVSYGRMGELYLVLDQRHDAQQIFLKSFAIAERLANAEPDRADYQRDLAVSLNSPRKFLPRPRPQRRCARSLPPVARDQRTASRRRARPRRLPARLVGGPQQDG